MPRDETKPAGLKNENLPAYPTEFTFGDEDFTGQPIINKRKCHGLTKREYFMAQALGGIFSKYGIDALSDKDCKSIILSVDTFLNNL
jgi:hypothetical protein